jgi:hypothetical protein
MISSGILFLPLSNTMPAAPATPEMNNRYGRMCMRYDLEKLSIFLRDGVSVTLSKLVYVLI